jgi:hypothetical protein
MATVRSIERQIAKVEGFKVRVLYEDGRDVRSDRSNLPGYHYGRALKGSANVREWIDRRFKTAYPGFDVEVFDADGRHMHGRTRLTTVRDTYLDGT